MASTGNALQATNAQPKIVLHWLENSRAQRIVWLLEELGLDFEIKTYKRIDKLAPPELKAIHPLGKSPLVTITTPSSTQGGSPNTLVLAESSFIVDYLTRTYKKLLPTPELELKYQHLLHFAEGSFMPPLTIGFVLTSIKNAPVPFFIRHITKMIVTKVQTSFLDPTYKANFEFLENSLKDSKFFCGDDVTGVDIMFQFPLESCKGRVDGYNEVTYPELFRWMGEIQKRPAYVRALKRTEEFEGTML
ncbi:glutathione S-transferase [Peziza echinospora]|nr:glutathione S-transferase [Peziza echinospora]